MHSYFNKICASHKKGVFVLFGINRNQSDFQPNERMQEIQQRECGNIREYTFVCNGSECRAHKIYLLHDRRTVCCEKRNRVSIQFIRGKGNDGYWIPCVEHAVAWRFCAVGSAFMQSLKKIIVFRNFRNFKHTQLSTL